MEHQRDWRRMIWGTALMGAGTALLLERLGRLPEWANRFQWWGGIVIFIGLATILCAKRAESVGSGVTIALLGGWFLLVTNHQFGLGWYNSWPLALVAAGAGTVGHAIAANWLPDTARARLRKRAGLDENAEESHA